MNELVNYIGEYMARLGLGPEQWGAYVRALQGGMGGLEGVDYGAVPADKAAQAQVRAGERGASRGIGWGLNHQILEPDAPPVDDRLANEIEFLKRARLHQALAPRGLYEALGGK